MSRVSRVCVATAATLFIAACSDSSEPTTPSSSTAPAARVVDAAGQKIPDQYIVVFRAGTQDAPGLARRLASAHGGELLHTYEHAIRGFAVRLPAQAAAAIARNPNVAYVEADQVVQAITTQSNATWGLDRVDQRDPPLDGKYTYDNTGSGVTAYIIDTGILYGHSEFGGRATFGFDAFGGNGADCNGHGTHVAGTVGGATYGVAKAVPLKAVRVLDCNGSGTTSGVIAGVDWVTLNHTSGPAVANMSLGGGFSQSLNDAVTNSINDGISYALAAGNGDRIGRPVDACNYSPASTPAGITVGATDKTDKEASFSNYGTCVDILAPGVSITSAWDDGGINTISGTSMAAPHAAGAAALYLNANPGATPATVSSALTSNASVDKITLHSRSTSGGTPNLLLYTGFIGGGTEPDPDPENSPPTSSFTFTCTDLACSFDGSASSDTDGSISSYAWNFGDGSSGSGATTSRTYAAGGTYTVTLTVTDDDAATISSSKSVTVSSSGGGGITLSATGYKVQGRHAVDLTWSGATSANVDIYRNTTKITTANDGAYTDSIGARGGATYTYKLCEAGTSTCSSEVTVTF